MCREDRALQRARFPPLRLTLDNVFINARQEILSLFSRAF